GVFKTSREKCGREPFDQRRAFERQIVGRDSPRPFLGPELFEDRSSRRLSTSNDEERREGRAAGFACGVLVDRDRIATERSPSRVRCAELREGPKTDPQPLARAVLPRRDDGARNAQPSFIEKEPLALTSDRDRPRRNFATSRPPVGLGYRLHSGLHAIVVTDTKAAPLAPQRDDRARRRVVRPKPPRQAIALPKLSLRRPDAPSLEGDRLAPRRVLVRMLARDFLKKLPWRRQVVDSGSGRKDVPVRVNRPR